MFSAIVRMTSIRCLSIAWSTEWRRRLWPDHVDPDEIRFDAEARWLLLGVLRLIWLSRCGRLRRLGPLLTGCLRRGGRRTCADEHTCRDEAAE